MGQILTRDEALGWTRKHGQRINAGDAAPILWESPYDSAYQLWLRKTGRVPPKEQTPEMMSGQITEPAIFAWYEQFNKLSGGNSQTWMAYEDAPFIQAKCDYWQPESKRLAEFKAPSRDDTRDHLTAKEQKIVPYHYWLQCQHLLNVFDVPTMEFVSWRGPDDWALIQVKRDDDFWALVMLPAYLAFQERVTSNAWPKPTGENTDPGEEWTMRARRWLDAKLAGSEYSAIIDREEAALKRLAEQYAITEGGGIRASWMQYKPRWEAVITAESAEALSLIMKAVASLEGRSGVGKVKKREYAPNLVLKISRKD